MRFSEYRVEHHTLIQSIRKKEQKMKKIILSLVIGMCFILPRFAFAEQGVRKAFHQGQKQKRMEYRQEQRHENKEFRTGIKDLSSEERVKAIHEHHQTQFSENKAFREQMHNQNAEFLKTKLANNKRLTDAQKTELINFMENQSQENVSFREKQHGENVAFFEQIANDPNMTQKQRKQAIKEHFATQKNENKDYWTAQKSEKKEFRQQLKSAAQQPVTT